MDRRRRPWAAALSSLLPPGLGHLYAGAPDRAVGAAIITFFAIPLWGICILLFASMPGLLLILSLFLFSLDVWIALDAARIARRQPTDYVLRPYNRWSAYVTWIVVIGLLAGQRQELTKRHLVRAFRVPSESMQPSLRRGDLIFARTFQPLSHLHHGSIVIFLSVEESGLKVIKRVVGMPGDTVAMRGGMLYRNGRAIQEPYAVHDDLTRHEDLVQRAKMREWQVRHLAVADTFTSYAPDLQDWGPLRVPPDSLLLLGDNRDFSYDSRHYGFVPRGHVIGRPTFVYYSYSYDPRKPRPWDLFSAPRWERVGTLVRE